MSVDTEPNTRASDQSGPVAHWQFSSTPEPDRRLLRQESPEVGVAQPKKRDTTICTEAFWNEGFRLTQTVGGEGVSVLDELRAEHQWSTEHADAMATCVAWREYLRYDTYRLTRDVAQLV